MRFMKSISTTIFNGADRGSDSDKQKQARNRSRFVNICSRSRWWCQKFLQGRPKPCDLFSSAKAILGKEKGRFPDELSNRTRGPRTRAPWMPLGMPLDCINCTIPLYRRLTLPVSAPSWKSPLSTSFFIAGQDDLLLASISSSACELSCHRPPWFVCPCVISPCFGR